MNARTIRRAAERAALKSDLKLQRSQTYAATPENKPAAASVTSLQPRPFAPSAPAQPAMQEPKTASPAQFAANQANAKLSTGPTSPEGKAISSRNNTIHGLAAVPGPGPFTVLPNEDQATYDASLAAYKAEWKPTTATELDLVERLTTHAWLRDRALRLQDSRLHLGLVEMKDYKQFEVYGRYYTTHLRAYNKAFADLVRLRSFQMRQRKDEALLERRAQDIVIRFESQRRKTEEHTAKMETVRLKQESQKQRNQRVKDTDTAATQSA